MHKRTNDISVILLSVVLLHSVLLLVATTKFCALSSTGYIVNFSLPFLIIWFLSRKEYYHERWSFYAIVVCLILLEVLTWFLSFLYYCISCGWYYFNDGESIIVIQFFCFASTLIHIIFALIVRRKKD